MRIKNNDLTHYFLRPHNQLPQGYLDHCNIFFKSLKCPKAQESCHPDGWPAGNKLQASSGKLQASSLKKQLHKPGRRVKNRFNRKI